MLHNISSKHWSFSRHFRRNIDSHFLFPQNNHLSSYHISYISIMVHYYILVLHHSSYTGIGIIHIWPSINNNTWSLVILQVSLLHITYSIAFLLLISYTVVFFIFLYLLFSSSSLSLHFFFLISSSVFIIFVSYVCYLFHRHCFFSLFIFFVFFISYIGLHYASWLFINIFERHILQRVARHYEY